MDIVVVFLWCAPGKCDTTNIDIITAATEDIAGNQISFNTIVINSPEEVKNSFEKSNVSVEEI